MNTDFVLFVSVCLVDMSFNFTVTILGSAKNWSGSGFEGAAERITL